MRYWSHSSQKEHLGQFSFTMRILITGGFGFVGGRLADYLAKTGNTIILGTRHSNGPPDWLPQAEIVKIAWDDEFKLERICNNVDLVIHAAGMNSQDCANNPEKALAFNGMATERLVLAASRAGVNKFIYISTAHVYSSPLMGNISEDTPAQNPHPYASSHLAGEYAVTNESHLSRMRGIVFRLSNTFGSPMDKNVNCWKLLINDLCRQAIQTRKLILLTDGLQQRNFICLTDVCKTIERFVTNDVEFPQTNIFNIGGALSQSVLQIAQLIQQRCNQVLDFQPEICLGKSKEHKKSLNLIYRSNYLTSPSINFQNENNISEIDKLLVFCKNSFT